MKLIWKFGQDCDQKKVPAITYFMTAGNVNSYLVLMVTSNVPPAGSPFYHYEGLCNYYLDSWANGSLSYWVNRTLNSTTSDNRIILFCFVFYVL